MTDIAILGRRTATRLTAGLPSSTNIEASCVPADCSPVQPGPIRGSHHCSGACALRPAS